MSAKQREAGWGTDKPTVAGWYWWREHGSKAATLMHLERDIDTDCLMSVDLLGAPHVRFSHSFMGGEWLGPITPDAYAAGLKAGKVETWRQAADLHKNGSGEPCEYCLALAKQIEAQGGSVRCQRCGGSGYTQSDDPARPLSRCGTCLGDGRYQPPQAQGGEHGK